MKGFTYVETIIVFVVILIILGGIIAFLEMRSSFTFARDLQRLQDAYLLYSALDFYFKNTSNFDPDGPYLDNKGFNEASPTIFISIPIENGQFPNGRIYCSPTSSYYVYQVSRDNLRKIDGYGWLPINFSSSKFYLLSNLPIDPINSLQSNLYYLYAFQRNPPQYEISLSFESKNFKSGGLDDKASTDGGNDPNRLELGTNLNLICPF